MNAPAKNIRALLRYHLYAIILACIIGIASGAPQLIGIAKNSSFAGIQPTLNDDEDYYLARTHEIAEGHITAANPYFAEYKTGPSIIAWLPELFFGMFSRSTGISVVNIFRAADFLLPFFATLLSYFAIFTLVQSRRWSLLGTIALNGGLIFTEMGRLISPQFNILFLLTFFWSIIVLVRSGRAHAAIIGGIALAFMINTYFFFWTYAAVFIVLLSCFYLYSRNYKKLRLLAITLLIGFIGGLPNFYSLLTNSKTPFYTQTTARFGAITSHFPSGIFIIILSLLCLACIFVAHKKKINENYEITNLLLSGSIAGLIVSNQHLVTGVNILFSSHYRLTTIIWTVITFSYIFSEYTKRLSGKITPLLKNVSALCIFILCALTITKTALQQINTVSHATNEQRYAPIFTWLTENSPPEAVVFANNSISNKIPIYTKNNVVSAEMATMSLVPMSDLINRLVTAHYGETIDTTFASEHQFDIWGAYFTAQQAHEHNTNLVKNIFHIKKNDNQKIQQTALDNFLEAANKEKQIPLELLLAKYNVRYFIADHTNDPLWIIEAATKFPVILSSKNITIHIVTSGNDAS